mmetsp:Transcript_71047/g.98708  ORF Transcript_71047/g.98708 Transcript_71047/m.98708 type:complete len:191 (-) Transcript_71047:466-1038(-)
MPPKSNKKLDASKVARVSKWYPTEEAPKTGVSRPYKAPALRKNIQPGQVVILLVGRYKGKRVIFLKQLQSGLILITGPHKINGVPLRRVNQSTVIPTSQKVDLAGVKFDDINDDYFSRTKVRSAPKSEQNFFAGEGLSEEEKKRIAEKKKTQSTIDANLLANIKKVGLLREYLRTRFTITNKMRVHELIF